MCDVACLNYALLGFFLAIFVELSLIKNEKRMELQQEKKTDGDLACSAKNY